MAAPLMPRPILQSLAAFAVVASLAWAPAIIQRPAQNSPAPLPLSMPNKAGSLKLGVMGDFGTGERAQYDMAATMARTHQQFKFTLMLLVGDNLYGSERPQDFKKKFEEPYKPLLDGGVTFRASVGNHDEREQRNYPLFNMGGELYYTFKEQNVRFFVIESTYPDPKQLLWLEQELKKSDSEWKIAYMHHPPYCSAGRHGSDRRLREMLEPLFVTYNVSVVFSGHDHVYERTKPQKDITYFVVGSTGKVAPGDLARNSPLTAKGFDSEQTFLIAEIDGDQMAFNAISKSGKVVDAGTLTRRTPKKLP
jgi:predicted MPP superfamily phosphohydrolase